MSQSNDTQNPMRMMFDVQRSFLQQGQQALQQTLDIQRNMTESLLRNNTGTGRTVQKQGTELAKNWTDAYVMALGSMMPQQDVQDLRSSVDDQFSQFRDAQDQAWDSIDSSVDDAVNAFNQLTQEQKQLIQQSVNSFYQAQSKMGQEAASVAQDIQEEAEQMSEEASSSSSSSSGSSGSSGSSDSSSSRSSSSSSSS